MATSELIINEHLGEVFRQFRPGWAADGVIAVENTAAFSNKAHRPDIIVVDNPMFPVGLETEFDPAVSVESDAASRLGKVYARTGGTIHAVVAVKYPQKYRALAGKAIDAALTAEDDIRYCLLTQEVDGISRWPSVGYVRGTVKDLVHVVASAKVSPAAVRKAAAVLEEGARHLAAVFETAAATTPAVAALFSSALMQEAGPQTYAMASTILINAFVFQDTLAGTSPELQAIDGIYGFKGGENPTKADVLSVWNKILKINYWPIFGISKALVGAIPSKIWGEFITSALATADRLLSMNLGKNPDLVGMIFQRLIFDRRFLATFYTAPSSAALLARLMIRDTTPAGGAWSDQKSTDDLRLADFACGTGSLLCSLYADVRSRMEDAGVDSKSRHKWMMENALIGCDVIPSATYITASQLSSVHPTVQYKSTKILTLPFGRMADGGVALGAIDLLERQGALSTISTTAGGVGAHSQVEVDAWQLLGGTAVADETFDYVAMNPPFTRLTGGGGKSSKVSRPLFAAFGTTDADQKDMAKRATKLFHGSAYHGNAGAASAFVEIADRKARDGGVVGLILPIAALSGLSWEECRRLWRLRYRDLITLSIASEEPGASAFSADTGVAECMVVATKSAKPTSRMLSVTLTRRPASTLEGSEIARIVLALAASSQVQPLEAGPVGGTDVLIGDEKVGEVVSTPMSAGPWSVSRIKDHALAQVAYQLSHELRVWLPGTISALSSTISLCPLSALGEAGPYHLDVGGGSMSGGAPRGPFEVMSTSAPASVSFPIIASHDESKERFVEIDPDAEGRARLSATTDGTAVLNKRRETIWATRTKLHFATDLRFNANALVAVLTKRLAVGGRAWPSFVLAEPRYEKALALWFNSSLGILSYWWLATKSQDGRGSVTTSRLGNLISIDPRSFSETKLQEIDTYFNVFKSKALLDIHECAADAHRAELDDFVARVILETGVGTSAASDGLQLLRAKLAAEPSIAGGRSGEHEDLDDDADDV